MSARYNILVVDDEPAFRLFVSTVLRDAGYEVTAAQHGAEALALLGARHFHLVLTDLRMPDVSGMEVLEAVRRDSADTPVIVITAFGTIESAVEATRKGAADYLLKPLKDPKELRRVVERVLRERSLEDAVAAQRGPEAGPGEEGIVGGSPALRRVLDLARSVAPSPTTVLLTGESGTGKEVIARAIHRWSPRVEGPFVAVNCAALPDALLESELFGHERGAFTGAVAQRRGRFELAHGGTLFLDEVGDMSPALQGKLLRVLEAQEFERVGGARTVRVDVRVIAATNADLGAAVAARRFREDLYYRLGVFPIHLPPLRERQEDILPLAEHFLRRLGPALRRPAAGFTPEAQERLQAYAWPGNVRELENVVERAIILARGEAVGLAELSLLPVAAPPAGDGGELKALEHAAILQALADTSGNRRQAAQRLGIGLRTLQYRLKHYGLTGRRGRAAGTPAGREGRAEAPAPAPAAGR
ncbi:MAG TPA: sigma-54 dependent transcriptional regulator [Candidatus Methylomirabilis sp.]